MKIINKILAKRSNLSANPAVTIALLGDSVTQGCFECYLTSDEVLKTVFDADSAYGSRLKSMLNLLYPEVQFNLINAGISGETARGGLKRLDRDVLAYHPDLVIVGFALNDSTSGLDGLDRYRADLSEILRKIAESYAETIVLTPNAMNTSLSEHLKEKWQLKLAERFRKLQTGGVLDRYVEVEKEIAGLFGATICDVYDKWKKMIAAGVEVTELLANKLNHPIRQMHYMTAMMLLDCMLS